MPLLTIEPDSLDQAARRDLDRRLVRYIAKTLAPVLPRVPATPEMLPPFVRLAGADAVERGFGERGLYGFYIITALLLGPDWEHHPLYRGNFDKYLEASGFDEETRIAWAMHAVIDARKQLEAALPAMLDAALASLNMRAQSRTPEDIWVTFQQIAQARGVPAHQMLALFEEFETFFRSTHGLPSVQRERICGYAALGYKVRNIPMPSPSEAIRGLSPHQLAHFNNSLLLALIYGPSYPRNIFLGDLLGTVDDPAQPHIYQQAMTRFLLAHRRAMPEAANG